MNAIPSLPEIDGLAALPLHCWQALGECLRAAGFVGGFFEERLPLGAGPWELVLRLRALRLRDDRQALATRLFMLRDPLPHASAMTLLGAQLLGALEEAGVVVAAEDGVVSVFDLRVYRGLPLLCDNLCHGGDAVFGIGPGTAAFALPRRSVRNALDLGCGAGAVALWLAGRVPRVVATDVNPRALVFVAINAAINGVGNVETCRGDLFAAVGEEHFDLVLSQPPYVPRPPDIANATYLHGGTRGDDILLRLLTALPHHLAPGGRAQLVFDDCCAERPDDGIARHWPFDRPMRTLLLRGARVDADTYCLRQAVAALALGPVMYAMAVTSLRDHLERLGVGSIRPAIGLIEQAPGELGWTEVVDAGTDLWSEVSGLTLDRLFAGRDWLQRPGSRESPRLHIPAGAVVIRPFAGGASPVHLGLPPGCLFSSVELEVERWAELEALRTGRAAAPSVELLAAAAAAGLIDG